MPEIGDPVRTTMKKVSVGDLLHDGRYIGIVVAEGTFREQEEIFYNIIWFDFFLRRHMKDMFLYEQAVVDYKNTYHKVSSKWEAR